MAFIGNSVENQGFSPAVDYYNGDGTTVTFTLSRPVASVAQLTAVIENVIQNPAIAFTVSGNSITFTSAPPAGTNNIWVEYTSLVTTYAAISQDPSVIGDITATGGYLAEGDFGNSYIDGTIVDYVTGMARITTGPIDDMTFYHGGTSNRQEMLTLYHEGGAKIYGTTALTIPVGTTAQRPGTPATGMVRYNTTESKYEAYNGTEWIYLSTANYPYAVEYLVIAGGAGGGYGAGSYREGGGGGGAGGYRSSVTGESSGGGGSAESPLTLTPGTAYTVTVGAGGAGVSSTTSGASGSNSVFGSITSVGGGGGANNDVNGNGGGSGGGAGPQGATGGSGTSNQGYAGGAGYVGTNAAGGGGGGAGAIGGNGTSSTTGNGGDGVSSSINGSATTRAGGGGGGGYSTRGTGGSGGGGNGGSNVGGLSASSGTANTGSGGGGWSTSTSGSGGSGIVIIRYAGAQKGTGGTVTSSGGYTIHTFTSSGTYTA